MYIYVCVCVYIYIYIVSDYRIRYAHNYLISDLSFFGIQIGIFTDMIFKFITSETIFIINSKFVSHQVHIHDMYDDFRCCFYSALSQWPAMGGCYIASMQGSSLRYLSAYSL